MTTNPIDGRFRLRIGSAEYQLSGVHQNSELANVFAAAVTTSSNDAHRQIQVNGF